MPPTRPQANIKLVDAPLAPFTGATFLNDGGGGVAEVAVGVKVGVLVCVAVSVMVAVLVTVKVLVLVNVFVGVLVTVAVPV